MLLFRVFLTLLLSNFCSSLPSEKDINAVYERKKLDILQANNNPEMADVWRNSLTLEGNWTDVDYSTGCDARRANWPIQDHFHRIITMSSHWSLNQWDVDLFDKISLALNYWFDRDFKENDCINGGGRASLNCPCGTPGFWNTNWFCQMILIPSLTGNACLLLKSNLTASQIGNCTTQLRRAYARIDGDPNGAMGPMTGANMLDVSAHAISLSILTTNGTLMEEALGRYYNEAQITFDTSEGIKVDGGFWQHGSQIYNGNYGAVFMRTLLKIFIQTSNTSIITPQTVQESFLVVIGGSEWLMYLKEDEKRLMWQNPVIGRMTSFKYDDWGGTGLSLDEILEATQDFGNANSFQEIVDRLKSFKSGGSNPGSLIGAKFFHVSDYLVYRGETFITTLKMFSKRTTNSECNNNQNPYGFHLSDGAIYTYLTGSEYINVQGAWDWDLIPGTTVDYNGTMLQCGRVQHQGVESFVGAVASTSAAVAVMNYTNPMNSSLHWKKTFTFFPNSYFVQFTGDVITTLPVYTTLDQRQLNGPVYIDGVRMEPENAKVTVKANSIWHDNVAYLFELPTTLTIDTTSRPSNWSEIGISVGEDEEILFSAVIEHPLGTHNADDIFYMAFLDVEYEEFSRGLKGITKVLEGGNQNEGVFRGAIYDVEGKRIIATAIWKAGHYKTGLEDITAINTNFPIVLLFERKIVEGGWTIYVADPSKEVDQVIVDVYVGGVDDAVHLEIELPKGAWAGSTTSLDF